MRISELSDRTGVSIPTLKYYLREGVLPPGRQSSTTRAEYDEDHVARVRLVRALVEVAGLSMNDVQAVTRSLDDPPTDPAQLFRVAAQALPTPHRDHAVSPGVIDLLTELDWDVPPDMPALGWLSAAVEAADSAGVPASPDVLRVYAESCLAMAHAEVVHLAGRSLHDAASLVVTGTILSEPVVAALRRVAQAHVARQAGGAAPGHPPRHWAGH